MSTFLPLLATVALQQAGGIPLWLILLGIFIVLVLLLFFVTSATTDKAQAAARAEALEADAPVEADDMPATDSGTEAVSAAEALTADDPIKADAAPATDSGTETVSAAKAATKMPARDETAVATLDEPEVDTEAEPDDLTVVNGIGPKTVTILNDAGILTYEQLSACTPDQLRQVVVEDGGLRLAQPASWPAQAALAAAGDWDQLASLQDSASGGTDS